MVLEDTTIFPQDPTDTVNSILCLTALAYKHQGTLYTDATGTLLAMLLDGHQYFCVLYHYNSDYIFTEHIVNVTNATLVNVADGVFTELTQKGFKPRFNVTDNQVMGLLKSYMAQHYCKWQVVDPSNHRVHLAERAIQTLKKPLHQ